MFRRLFVTMLGIAAVVAVVPLISRALSRSEQDVVPLPFEPAAWKRADEIEGRRTVRSQMVDDLIARNVLDGLNRSDVESLLGPPIANLREAGISQNWDIAYKLGIERSGSLSLDDEFLVIRFDKDGKVSEYVTAVN